MQVYACVYTTNGDFLLATKRERGYFFMKNGVGGIVKNGQVLNGAGRRALPGGKRDPGESTSAGALREWNEETYCDLQTTNTQYKDWKLFGAGYFLQPEDSLAPMVARITKEVLPAANLAAGEIQEGKITEYAEIAGKYPDAPADNELADMEIWNLDTDWTRIETWKNHPDIGWYYDVLHYLKTTILKL